MRIIFYFFLCCIGFHAFGQGAILEIYQSPFYKKIVLAKVSYAGDHVVASDESGHLLFWGRDGSIRKILRAHSRAVSGISFSGDRRHFTTTADNDQVTLWDFETGEKKGSFSNASRTLATTFSGEGFYFALYDGIYRTSMNNFDNPEKLLDIPVSAADHSTDSKYMVAGSDNTLSLISLTDGKVLSKTNTCDQIRQIEFRDDLVCSFCEDRSMELFEKRGTDLVKIAGAKSPIIQPEMLLVVPGKKIVLVSEGRTLLWDALSGKIYDVPNIPQDCTALDYGDRGNFLAGNNTGQVTAWNMEIGMEIMTVSQPPVAAKEAAIEDQSIKVEMTTGGVPRTINGRPVITQQPPMEVASPTLDIYVWDDEREDGDTISLNLNGEWLLYGYMITAEKKKLTFNLVPGRTNYLILYAHNLGKFPPNTAVISFNDGREERRLTLESDLRKCSAISFVLK